MQNPAVENSYLRDAASQLSSSLLAAVACQRWTRRHVLLVQYSRALRSSLYQEHGSNFKRPEAVSSPSA